MHNRSPHWLWRAVGTPAGPRRIVSQPPGRYVRDAPVMQRRVPSKAHRASHAQAVRRAEPARE